MGKIILTASQFTSTQASLNVQIAAITFLGNTSSLLNHYSLLIGCALGVTVVAEYWLLTNHEVKMGIGQVLF